MAAGDHGGVRVGWQAGDDLIATGHLAGNDGHDGSGEKGETAAGHIGTHAFDGDDAVAEMEAGERLNL